jgi:hypothetical protein
MPRGVALALKGKRSSLGRIFEPIRGAIPNSYSYPTSSEVRVYGTRVNRIHTGRNGQPVPPDSPALTYP